MIDDNDGPAGYVSTGTLPPPGRVQSLVDEAYELVRDDNRGTPSTVYPALALMPPDLFGLCVVDTAGRTYRAGVTDRSFTIMSVVKPFTFALVCDVLGVESVHSTVGVNATGLPFNSLDAIERGAQGRTNPMVNAGAIATVALAPGRTVDDKWAFLRDGLCVFADRELHLDQEVADSARSTNTINAQLAQQLHEHHALACPPDVALELYTRVCCLHVTAIDLAVMGCTLADGGVHPISGRRVVSADSTRATLAVMATAGLYETSGDWLVDVGLPGKSGISGGVVTVSPGKGALATFAPRLDAAGNSVKGREAAAFLARALGLDLFASMPATLPIED